MGAAAGGHNVQGHAWTRWAADLRDNTRRCHVAPLKHHKPGNMAHIKDVGIAGMRIRENDVGRRPAGDGCREEVYKFLLLGDAQGVPYRRAHAGVACGQHQATKG